MNIEKSNKNQLTANLSCLQWPGLQCQRFKGGRFHNNHPADELDNLLMGTSSLQDKILGPTKKKFQKTTTIGTDQPRRPHIRLNQARNDSTIVFSAQYIPKLIKIPPSGQYKPQNSIIFRHSQIGQSKLKNLQTGELKSGIYRNFYKSQFKQSKSSQIH